MPVSRWHCLSTKKDAASSQSEKCESIAFDNAAKRFARHDGQLRSLRHLVQAVERLDAFDGAGVREIRSEQQFLHHAILMRRDQRVVRLPWSAQKARNIRVDIRVLAEQDDGL